MAETTYTATQIRDAVMNYHQGCTDGKAEFLSDAFDIEANPTRTFHLTVKVTLPTLTDEGEEVDASDVAAALECIGDQHAGSELSLYNEDGIDFRVRVATPPPPVGEDYGTKPKV